MDKLSKLLIVALIVVFMAAWMFLIRNVNTGDDVIIIVTAEACDRSVSEILGPVIAETKGISSSEKRTYLFRALDIPDDAIDCAIYHKLNPQDIIYCPSGYSEPGKKDLFLFSDKLPDSKKFKITKWREEN